MYFVYHYVHLLYKPVKKLFPKWTMTIQFNIVHNFITYNGYRMVGSQ